MTRRKSLLELAKKLRGSRSSSQCSCSPTKNSLKSVEVESEAKVEPASSSLDDSEELDENGNVIKRSKNWGRVLSDICTKSPAREADSSSKRTHRRRSQQVLFDHDAGRQDISASSGRLARNPKVDSLDERGWVEMRRQLERMSDEELQSLLVTDEKRLLDHLIVQKPMIKQLDRQRAALKKQVLSLAEANYAREPELVRDRLRLRNEREQLARMVRQTESRLMEPILLKLNEIQNKLVWEARRRDEQSEAMAEQFLKNGANRPNDAAVGGAAESCSLANYQPVFASSYEHFIHNFIDARKASIKKSVLTERLAAESNMLLSNMTYKSQIATARQSQSAMAAEVASISSADSFVITTTSGLEATSANANTTSSLAADTNRAETSDSLGNSLLEGPISIAAGAPKPKPRRRKKKVLP